MSVRVPDERLDELAALAEAATPAPWFYDGRDIFAEQHGEGGHRLVIPLPETWHESQGVNKEDALFVAAAGSDLAALVADLRSARADNQRLNALKVYADHLYTCAVSRRLRLPDPSALPPPVCDCGFADICAALAEEPRA